MNLLYIMLCIFCIVLSYKFDIFYVGYVIVEYISLI